MCFFSYTSSYSVYLIHTVLKDRYYSFLELKHSYNTFAAWQLITALPFIPPTGPDAVRPPLRVSVQFGHPLVLPRREAAIRFWAANGREDVDGREDTNVAYRFQLHDEARGICHLIGEMLGESG